MKKIAVATANRAERGLLEPVIKRLWVLHDDGKIDFRLVEPLWSTDEFGRNLQQPEFFTHGTLPDVILIPADRREMRELAGACWNAGIPIFHIWAGASFTDTEDDMNRRIISSFSYLMFCEDDHARSRVIDSGEEPWRVITTGTTHFDDLALDYTHVPKEPYDLILILPNPVDLQDERDTVTSTLRLLETSGGAVKPVWIGNVDAFSKYADFTIPPWVAHYPNLPRMQFLALLKGARRFISNSSSTIYEAPFFGTPVVNPGKRNAERTFFSDFRPGAPSDRIVDLLCNYPLDPAKRLKVYYK